jgi:hypothetical protein
LSPEYCAGLADSDGSFGIAKRVRGAHQPTYSARFIVHWKFHELNQKVFEFMRERYGGTLRLQKNKGTLYHSYQLSDKSVDRFLEEVGPHVVLKARQVELLRRLRSTIRRGGGERDHELIQLREEMYIEMKRLNEGDPNARY